MLNKYQIDEYNENGFTILDYKLSEDDLEDILDRISDLEDCNGQGPDYKQHLCEGTHELEELESDIAELFAKFDMLDSDISDLLKDMSKIEKSLSSLEKSVDKLDSHKDKESDKGKEP